MPEPDGNDPKDKPPCPTKDGPPPGHNKTSDPDDRPCGEKKGNGGDAEGGVILILPLLAGTAAWSTRPERLRRRFRAR